MIWLVALMAPQIISSIPQQISADVDVKIPLDVPSCPKGNFIQREGRIIKT